MYRLFFIFSWPMLKRYTDMSTSDFRICIMDILESFLQLAVEKGVIVKI